MEEVVGVVYLKNINLFINFLHITKILKLTIQLINIDLVYIYVILILQ